MFNIKAIILISRKSSAFTCSNKFASVSGRFISVSKPILASKPNSFLLPCIQSRSIFSNKPLSNSDTSNSGEKMPTAGEKKLIDMLKQRFPKAKCIEVQDISGGCGSMYAIYVETIEFKNIKTVKQHQLINEVLKAEIKNNMHGLRIQTAVADS